ncbi:MAG: hypothetical protein KGZ39_03700 [Simkania sp.]|nr:hypothetical protein [Simkania sp.]
MITWKELTGLYLGGAFCLPLLLIGFRAGSQHGLCGALIAIALGNLALTVLALFTSRLGVVTRKTTVELAEEKLGPRGGPIFAGAILLIHLLWFALQLDLIAQGSYSAYFILGFLSVLSVLGGVKKLSYIANLALPILMGVLFYAMLRAPLPTLTYHLDGIEITTGIFIAAGLAAVMEMPTYFKKARSIVDSRVASLLIFGLGVPLIEGGGAYLGASMPQGHLITILESGLSWTSLFLIIAGVTTNNNNLYAASVYAERFFRKGKVVFLAALGIFLSLLHPAEQMQSLLPLMALPLGSIGGVILGKGTVISFIIGLLCGFFGPIPLLTAFIGSYLASIGERRYAAINNR